MPLAAAANALALPLTALLLRLAVLLNLLLWAAATGDPLPQQPEACANFTGGAGFQSGFFTFTTPNYPARYPARSDCIKLIRAEYPHQVVKLDFRDEFFIEDNSQCATDYLEIRDGPYGYSPQIPGLLRSRVCGRGPPRRPPLVSTGRYLWLRFRSDDSIEHAGMKAVYSFEQANNVRQECRLELRLPVDRQEVLTTKQLKDKIPAGNATTKPVDCSIDATSPEDTKIFFSLESMVVRRDDACDLHQLTFFDGFTSGEARDGPSAPVCKSLEEANAKGHLSTKRRVVIRVTSRDAYLMPDFVVVLTVVRLGVCQEATEFECGEGQCIDSRLVCNSHINCPDGRDEANCAEKTGHGHGAPGGVGGAGIPESTVKTTSDRKSDEMSYHPIILGSIGAGFLILTMACCCVTFKQRLKERRANHCSAEQADAAAATAASAGLSREPSVRAATAGGPDSPMLPHLTSLHQTDGFGPYGKQNGAAPLSVHQLQHQAMPQPQPKPPQVTPSRVRVGKFLDPIGGSCEQDSPIVEIFSGAPDCPSQQRQQPQFGYRTPPPAAARRLAGGFSKQESSDTAASSSGGAGSSSFAVHPHSTHPLPPPPPPPPPPPMPLTPGCERRAGGSGGGRRGVVGDPRLVPSRSIPGHLGESSVDFDESESADENSAAAAAPGQRHPRYWLTKQRSQPATGEYQLHHMPHQYQHHHQQQQQQFEMMQPHSQFHYQQQQQQQPQQMMIIRRTPPSGGQQRKTKMVFQA
ncbi:hypothetical protein BOX15_Mlig023619g2 [Macrostomum lignano]|uniref:CUB domain-containing protein n=1 Tax=Macrostomum lignano TaxID=282301 RepID=A0A267GL66_9PLAT|nr:hypothetical protein BOX15_Mlig023619g2 [Macrostomum lignano]